MREAMWSAGNRGWRAGRTGQRADSVAGAAPARAGAGEEMRSGSEERGGAGHFVVATGGRPKYLGIPNER